VTTDEEVPLKKCMACESIEEWRTYILLEEAQLLTDTA